MATGLEERTDGNNVDLDREMARLKQNAMMFRTFSQLLSSQMDVMRKAMTS
jgi:flagellar basal-body rod protein FlgB